MVTRFLVILNVIGFLWELKAVGPGILNGNVYLDQLRAIGALDPADVLQNHEWWRIVTSAFLHGSLIHIGVNMISLWSLGTFIELALGSPRMLFVYVISLVAAGLGIVYLSLPNTLTVGASGAIFGLFGALFAVGFKLGRRGMDLVRANVGILVLNLIITFAVPGISWQAHLAGLIVGFLITYAIYFPPRPMRPLVVDTATGNAFETEYQEPQQPTA